MKRLLSTALALCAGVVAAAPEAHAGGYDTPILYSARHIGMGGTAVSNVEDPSALFHNPAGLANIDKASAMINVSPLIGNITSAPLGNDVQVDSETTFAPFFLAGGAYRFTDWLVAGMAVYPVASAGAEYKYDIAGTANTTKTRLVFIEASPGVALDLPYGFNLGVGYRITSASLERFQGNDANKGLDFEISGLNLAGVRAGLQWEHEIAADQRVRVGVNYRHKTSTTLEADDGIGVNQELKDISMEFVLPSRLVGGVRYDVQDFGVAVDVEYGFNSQNEGYPLRGTLASNNMSTEINNFFRWKDSITLRTGVEYRTLEDRCPVRLGFIWDQQTANEQFPSAFGTPPGDGYIATLGTGWNAGAWQVNAAYAYRTVSGEVTTDDLAAGQAELDADFPGAATPVTCQFCSAAGDYELTMHGIYLDFSYDF